MSRRAWTQFEDDVLRQHFARTLTADLAELFGRSLSSTHQRAKVLGLRKDRAWIAETARQRVESDPNHGSRRSRIQAGAQPWNKGTHFVAGGRSAETQFRAGRPAHEARNYQPIGTTRITRDGLLERKVTDDPSIVPARRWIPVHRLVWIDSHGEIPMGHIVVFRKGMRTLVEAEITVDRLECVTRAEHARRNQYPTKELRQIAQLRGAITRQVNKRLKEQSA